MREVLGLDMEARDPTLAAHRAQYRARETLGDRLMQPQPEPTPDTISLRRFLTRVATLADTLQQLETCSVSRATREELLDVAQEWGREAATLLQQHPVVRLDGNGNWQPVPGLRSDACPDADWRDGQEVR